MIWSSCGKTPMDEIERIHVRAAKIVYKLDWSTPSDQVLDMNSKCLSCFAYKCYYGQVPEQLQSIVRKSNYTYDFRRKLGLALPVAARLWNSLTNEHRAPNNIASFKAILRADKF